MVSSAGDAIEWPGLSTCGGGEVCLLALIELTTLVDNDCVCDGQDLSVIIREEADQSEPSAINCDAGCGLQDRLEAAMERSFAAAVRHKENVFCLQRCICAFSAQDFFQVNWNLLASVRRLGIVPDNEALIPLGGGSSVFSEGHRLKYGHSMAALPHDKSSRLVHCSHNIDDRRARYRNAIPGVDIHIQVRISAFDQLLQINRDRCRRL